MAMCGRRWFTRFRTDESGATAIEYGLLCAMIAIFLIGIAATGGALEGVYDRVSDLIPALGG
jgi:pilus assembly protein Flp/PilA